MTESLCQYAPLHWVIILGLSRRFRIAASPMFLRFDGTSANQPRDSECLDVVYVCPRAKPECLIVQASIYRAFFVATSDGGTPSLSQKVYSTTADKNEAICTLQANFRVGATDSSTFATRTKAIDGDDALCARFS